MDIEMTLHALISEVSRLESLASQLNTFDQRVLHECSVRINQLVLDKLSNDNACAYVVA